MIVRDKDKNADGNTTDAADERLYAQQDANWNITAVVGKNGSNWEIFQRFVYTPFGAKTRLASDWTTPGTDTYLVTYGWQGRPFESASSINQGYFRNRVWLVGLGRWEKNDPSGMVDGTNLYKGMGNGPVGTVDPLGLQGASQSIPVPGKPGGAIKVKSADGKAIGMLEASANATFRGDTGVDIRYSGTGAGKARFLQFTYSDLIGVDLAV